MAQEKKQSQDIGVYAHIYMCMQSTLLEDKDIKVGGSDFKISLLEACSKRNNSLCRHLEHTEFNDLTRDKQSRKRNHSRASWSHQAEELSTEKGHLTSFGTELFVLNTHALRKEEHLHQEDCYHQQVRFYEC